MVSFWCFTLDDMHLNVQNSEHHQVKIISSHYIAILSKSSEDLELLVSSLGIWNKKELQVFVISCTNI